MWTYRRVLLCLAIITLSGCGTLSRPADTSPPPQAATAAPEETVTQPSRVADAVQQLLAAAEAALVADKLTTPLHDNAFDRFQAVLLLDPGNDQARSGLQQVFARYVSMARTALDRNDPGRARAVLERARLVKRDHPALDDLAAQIDKLWTTLSQQGQGAAASDGKEFVLDIRQLDRKGQKLVEQLKELALQVQQADETLLIIARNDAEGRWIYQRMNEGAQNYRLRGDIQLGRTPKVLVLPPID